MTGKCSKCGDQELIQKLPEIFRHGLPQLGSPFEIDIGFVCPNCGQEVRGVTHYLAKGIDECLLDTIQRDDTRANSIIRKQAKVREWSSSGQRSPMLQYPAVFRTGDNVLFPTHEGNIQDGTVIDQHGDPDLVIEFAEEYFKQYWAIVPSGKLPNTLSEIMPALHLLVIATELAIKAFLIRSDKDFKTIHTLSKLYEDLDCEHRKEIEKRFADSGPNSNLKGLGVKGPTVKDILGMYDNTYGGESSVYLDTRYYAEPTTTFKPSSNLNGANLVKGNTPYPIFLPMVVRALIDTFRFYSGPERLRRLGADIQDEFRGSGGNDNHGEWGLIPSSLSLVVISVSQRAARNSNNEELEVFRSFKTANPPSFSTSWMYGGNTLLFYSAGGRSHSDGRTAINGLVCRLRHKERLGMHSRDMYLLADALDCGSFSELVVD